MSKYIVKTPINHDKEDYAPGDSIELDAKPAKPLLAVGAIEAAPGKTKNGESGKSDGGKAGEENSGASK
jgi:hypothetical protein